MLAKLEETFLHLYSQPSKHQYTCVHVSNNSHNKLVGIIGYCMNEISNKCTSFYSVCVCTKGISTEGDLVSTEVVISDCPHLGNYNVEMLVICLR